MSTKDKLEFVKEYCTIGIKISRHTRAREKVHYHEQVQREEERKREVQDVLQHPNGITKEKLEQIEWDARNFATLKWPRWNQAQRDQYLRLNPAQPEPPKDRHGAETSTL